MPQPDSFHVSRGLKRPPKMRRSGSKRMSTGQLQTPPRRTALAAGVGVTLISEMWKGKKGAVWLSGSRSLAGGHHLEPLKSKPINVRQKMFDYAFEQSGVRCLFSNKDLISWWLEGLERLGLPGQVCD
jgi:hypothetical protein